MANTSGSGERRELQQRAAARPYWDPFGILSGFAGWWDPLGALRPSAPTHTFVPAFEGRDTKDAYVLEADLPGIQESELEMSVTGTQLSVRGKRESGQREQHGRYFCAERGYGTFDRTFTLPDDAELDQVNAEFRDGVLRVEIPKRPQAQPRRIAVSGAGGGHGGQRQLAAGGQQQAGASRPPSAKGTPRALPRRLGGAHPRPRRRPRS
jgi:HSP20 family protein